jgi:hypothetical protein
MWTKEVINVAEWREMTRKGTALLEAKTVEEWRALI